MRIGLDMMGGDYAPAETAKGVQLYSANNSASVKLCLYGKEDALKALIPGSHPAIEIFPASEVITMHESPTRALKDKPDSSISIGFKHLATGEIDAFISAGNTGAMLVGALYSIKAIEGVLRPTISTVVPKIKGGYGLLLDVGLNADCKPENLLQCAILGNLYAKHILNISNPKIGLINIGEEEGKGNILAQAAYESLKNNDKINFIGNVEGRDVFTEKADVMVCDGFTGNVILKLAESIYDIARIRHLQDDEYLKRFHYENYGGTPVLGVSKPVIIGHGISTAKAFKNMIILAQKMIETDLMSRIKESFISH